MLDTLGWLAGDEQVVIRVERRWRRALAMVPLGALATGGTLQAAPADDLAYGAYLAAECFTCHAEEASTEGIPSLQELPTDRLAAVLSAYRDGSRPNPVMQAVARALGPAEVAALAAYLSTRKCAPRRVDGTAC
jgi:cytochrome c